MSFLPDVVSTLSRLRDGFCASNRRARSRSGIMDRSIGDVLKLRRPKMPCACSKITRK